MGLEHVRRDGRILIIRRYRPEARMFQNISADRLEALLDQGRAFTLADVREPEEYREGHLAGAVNLPVQQILKITEQSGFFEDPEKFLGISRKRPVIVYCSHGGRIPGGQCLRRAFLLPGPPSDRRSRGDAVTPPVPKT